MRNLLMLCLLFFLVISCQQEQSSRPAPLLNRVIESPEFEALVKARSSGIEKKMQSLHAERAAFKESLEGLSQEEKEARWAERRKEKDEEHQAMLDRGEKLRERNERAMALAQENPDWSKEQFEAAIAALGREMSITPEMLMAARPGNLSLAMDALLKKFPEIKEVSNSSDFLKECFEAYQAKNI